MARWKPLIHGISGAAFSAGPTYDGSFPGPTIKVKKGDILKVHFKNSLPDVGMMDIWNIQ